jgi:hypothetical protein
MTDASRALRRSAVTAGAIALLDALVFNQGFVSLGVVLVALLVLLPRALWVWRDRPLCQLRLATAWVYLATALLAVGFVKLNNRTGRARAQALVRACEEFKAKHQHYPETLEALVPEFIPHVPAPKWVSCLSPNAFSYSSAPGQHRLEYVAIPPFGKVGYVFEEGRWRFRD